MTPEDFGFTCYAEGCEKATRSPRTVFCPDHWQKLPVPLRERIQRLWKPGFQRWGRKSKEYVAAVREGIAHLRQPQA